MKTNFKSIAILFFGITTLVSCNKDDAPATPNAIFRPSTGEWYALRNESLQNQLQEFTMNAQDGLAVFISDRGVTISIDGSCLTKNGNPVTGQVDIDFVELFDKGHMLTTNKPTMGIMPDGNKNLLLSGGEFFIEATQGGVKLATTCNINLVVPTNLTDSANTSGMLLWVGDDTDADNLAWKRADNPVGGQGGVDAGGGNYYVSFGNFGWTNVDKFYSDPRPKTTILVDVPAGYDNTNSAVYLSYDGEGLNQLAKMDTYTPAGLFSEHYGQIPVGLACHIIFATEDNGQWRYAIKGVTTTANAIYTFVDAETVLGTEAQLIAAINAIQ
ncbi:hypothetical protein [Flavobacterium sp.]|uniref:hypothetical protein n=1 Tax=Flavobacterium sp. TaxID=239 RepID=UPI00286E203D|nr:hypothetical protein [Flavobacterium sp.]